MFIKLIVCIVVLSPTILAKESENCKRYSKCEYQRGVALARTSCGMTGVTIPSCEEDGRFSLKQCKSTPYCCCADPENGEQTESCVRVPEEPDCGKKVCEEKRAAALKLVELGLLGVFVPRCKEEGTYHPFQTIERENCCADLRNGELSNCVFAPKLPECVKKDYSKCEYERAVALEKSNNCPMLGADIPECEEDGSYSSLQCGPTGYCCCAHPECGKQPKCARAPNMPDCSK